MNYFTLLAEQSRNNGSRTFVIIENQPYTYEQIYTDCVDNFSGLELSTAQAVLIKSPQLYFQLTAFLGLQKGGAVPIIAHYDLPEQSFMAMMRQNAVRLVLTDTPWQYEGLRLVQTLPSGFLYELTAVQERVLSPEICMGALSSGSTGVPKVLYRSFASWSSFFTVQNDVFRLASESVLFLEGSLSFTGNLNLLADTLSLGATAVLTNVFRCQLWLDMLARHNVSAVYLVPAKLRIMAKAFRGRSFAGVRSIISGSQLLSEEVGQSLLKAMPQAELILYYGASELNYISWLNFSELKNHSGSVGRPFKNVRVYIEDGLIYVDSDCFVYGQSRPGTVCDTGSIDADGYIIFGGRASAIINRGGYKVSCFKVEGAIKEHPAVRDAVVLGYEEDGHGSQVAAFIAADDDLSRSDMQSFLSKRLTRQELPRRYVFVAEIPLNSRGKPSSDTLKELL